jgi:predicted acyltransferase
MTTDPPLKVSAATPDHAEDGRLLSLDALRGFAIFWVVLANTVLDPDRFIAHSDTVRSLATSLGHRDWEGLSVADVGFPLFVFIAGVSTVLSLGKLLQRHGRSAAHARLLRRFVLLFSLGVIYNGGLTNPWPDVRLLGVLQRLAICGLVAGLLFCRLRPSGLAAACVAILVGYWAWFTFVPVPGLGVPSLAKGANWAWYIDHFYLPGHKLFGEWDPEGVLSTIPAIASCLLGVLAGQVITHPSIPDKRKLLYFSSAGVAGVLLGFLWHLQFPIIKNLWTSSFVLVTGGYSCLMVGAFYLVVDMWRFRSWTTPFLWLGHNALAMYLVINLVDFRAIARRFVGGDIHATLAPYGDVSVTVLSLALVFVLARFLYRKRIFFRI